MSSRLRRADSPPASDSEDTESRGEEEGWSDAGEDDEEETPEVISLLDDRVFPDVLSMLAHCREKHSFDFLGIRQRLQLDFHGCVKLVNFIRQRVHEGLPVTEDLSWCDIDHEQYLKPVLDDDAVILGLFDLPELKPAGADMAQGGGDTVLVDDLLKRNTELQEELVRVKAQFDSYRVAVQQTLDERWGDVDQAEAEASSKKGKEVEKKEDSSKSYWESYAGVDIHETMLKDTVRTDAYRDFIYNNKHLFAGKTVLDIGCGTGILSMFCARAGAAKVIAVDASAIITKAQENVFHNGLSHVITCVHGKMEEVTLPGGVEQVDVIVSEWMGYCLLFEAMLPSVLYARDRYLRPGGLLVPSHANLWLAPVADPDYVADNVHFWRDVYGFDMRAMQSGIYDDARVLRWASSLPPFSTPSSSRPDDDDGSNTIVGPPAAFKLLDLYAVTTPDLSFTAPFASGPLARDVDPLDGFLIWFDIFFAPTRDDDGGGRHAVELTATADAWARADPQNRVAFTTGPYGRETHWKQGLLLCKPERARPSDAKDGEEKKTTAAAAPRKKGDEIKGEITFSIPEDHARGLSLKVTWDGGSKKQTWALH
ncbi:S-adenosyl-L-methionine-dependent methyltransferase [Hypoxylon cercidicola]|nr:S-adenosyl-L-methionine-dependent methyltransferase [Hypoxylon cercidicola]